MLYNTLVFKYLVKLKKYILEKCKKCKYIYKNAKNAPKLLKNDRITKKYQKMQNKNGSIELYMI